MENISLREVIQRLAKGFDLSSLDETKFEQEVLHKGIAPSDHAEDLASHLLYISMVCSRFLESVGYAKNECAKVDELWKLVDDNLIEYDIENIENIAESIVEVIDKRRDQFSELEKSKLVEQYKEK